MTPIPTVYRVASQAAGRRLLQRLAEALPSRAVDPVRRRTTFLDTFDWRVCRDDGLLRLEPDDMTFLTWTTIAGDLRHRLPVREVPAFAWDLPEGPLRRALEPVVEMRRLLPLAEVKLSVRGLELVDKLEKTVCRVTLESGQVAAPDGDRATKRLAPVLRVTPVKGYPDAFRGVLRRLDGELGVARCDESELRRVLKPLGREPCDVPQKQTYDVRAGKRADAAMKAIHRALLDTFKRNEPGMRADLDSEFLHDARVAVRRTRSALTQIPGVFPGDVVRRFKREFRWLGGITGPTRDLDVYLLKIPGYRAALDARHRGDLDPLVDLLRERQREAQQRLVQDLDTPRFAELMRDWETFLASPTPRVSGLPDAMRPIEQVAGARIWRAWKKVMKRGGRIGPDSPAELLHRLRIDCKKLRYLLEFFTTLYPRREVKRLVSALKKLQNNLGDLNDLAVQAEALRGFEKALAARGVGRGTLRSLERLVEQLETRRIQDRQDFETRFAEFSDDAVGATFRNLFQPPQDGAS